MCVLLFCPKLFPAVSWPSVTGTSLLLSAQGKRPSESASNLLSSSSFIPCHSNPTLSPHLFISASWAIYQPVQVSTPSSPEPFLMPHASASALPLLKCFLPVASRHIYRGTIRLFLSMGVTVSLFLIVICLLRNDLHTRLLQNHFLWWLMHPLSLHTALTAALPLTSCCLPFLRGLLNLEHGLDR